MPALLPARGRVADRLDLARAAPRERGRELALRHARAQRVEVARLARLARVREELQAQPHGPPPAEQLLAERGGDRAEVVRELAAAAVPERERA